MFVSTGLSQCKEMKYSSSDNGCGLNELGAKDITYLYLKAKWKDQSILQNLILVTFVGKGF